MMTRRSAIHTGLAAVAAVATAGSSIAQAAIPTHRSEGQGEPVLLIAGYSCDLSVWDVVAPLIVAKGFRVIRFNNLGVGRNARFSPTDITIRSMAQQAADLLSALQLSAVHVVGHSMGGQIAQELALAAPEHVGSLTLLSTWASPSKRLISLLTEMSALAGTISPEAWQRSFLPWVLTDAAYAAPGLVDQIVQANVANPDQLSAALLQAQADAIDGSDTSSRLSELKRPTLVAVGEQDVLTPPSYSQAVNHAIKGSEFTLLPGGHGFIAEAAPQLADRLAAFHREHSIPQHG
jgi:3-oxoadipate enol-lactonase